jgi:outer membrane protein insertion porin family
MRILNEDVVLVRLSHRRGDPLDPQRIDQEMKRIWDMGYFSDVQVSAEQGGEGLVLVYTVAEKPRVENIIVEGSRAVSPDDVRVAMGTKVGSVLNERVLAQDLQRVAALYHKAGYHLVRVDYRL